MSGKHRGFCWTINNPTGWDLAQVEALADLSTVKYQVYGEEVGQEGTPHFQGFTWFVHPVRFHLINDVLTRAHIEPSRGSPAQAADYCKKDGKWKEWGIPPTPPGKGAKDMWRKIIEWAEAGDLERIKLEFPGQYVLHQRKLLDLRRRSLGILDGDLQNEWWVGPTGTGKSRTLWQLYPSHYGKALNKWWDGYEDEDVVAIEEFDPEHGKYLGHFIKIWADRYPFSPEVKGSHIKKIRPIKIIILSNFTIDECFERIQDREPIKRRFKVKRFSCLSL